MVWKFLSKEKRCLTFKDGHMKKIILTGCAAILFGIGAIAQDTTSINNNLRQGAQEVEEETQEAGNELRQESREAGEEIKEESQEAGQDAKEAGNELREGAERTGEEIEEGAEKTGEQIEQGAEKTGEQIEQGAERTGEEMEEGAERTKDQLDQDGPSSQNNQDPNATGENAVGAAPAQHEVEVLEDKEGPNNQVVYKYQGELYYVDRDQKQLVPIEESQLKDAEHKAIISDDAQDESKKNN